MRDNVILVCVVVVATSSVFTALVTAWLCGHVSSIRSFLLRTPEPDTDVKDALDRLEADRLVDRDLAVEAVRLAKRTSSQVDVAAELGHQAAEANRHVAADLAKSIHRADIEASGEPGAAADAGLKSDPEYS